VAAGLLVEGALLDADGARAGYARFRAGRLVETGAIGTDSTRGGVRKIRGIVVPSPVNGHTHLGDAVATREPPNSPIADIVRPPDGYKFRLLQETAPAEKRRAMRAALQRMDREGVAATVDFREEGAEGVQMLRDSARGLRLQTVILGRTLARPIDRAELDHLLRVADGVGLSAVGEEPLEVRRIVGTACRQRGKLYALHASESAREPVDDYLHPRPDLLVHLTEATAADLAQVVEAGVTVSVCPRSNALFGRRPDLALFHRLGVRTMLGTDNAMFHSPSIWRELEFAYVTGRLMKRPVTPEFLFRAAFVEPYRWLGEPDRARLHAGSPARPLVFRLPADDPEYQVVTRATAHVMVRPETSGR
jgi:cytosine/adenosine deaminase-related metal-dependent hydrolase